MRRRHLARGSAFDGEREAALHEVRRPDHLVVLPRGDTALTRRTEKHSGLWAVILRFSRARKRYERQGLLVEEVAERRDPRAFPRRQPKEAASIAAHTTVSSSGRVGRTAAGQSLDPGAITAAAVAAIRHKNTRYDELLMAGVPRFEARAAIRDDLEAVLERWTAPRH